MPDDTLAIAKKLTETRAKLDELWERTSDASKRAEIVRQLVALDKQAMRLISIHVKAAGQEYAAACKALDGANKDLQRAADDIEAFVGAMEAVAAAMGAVAKVLAA